MRQQALESLCLVSKPLVPAFGSLLRFVHPAFHHFRIGHNQLQIDDVDVPQGIGGAFHVGHVGVVKAAHHVDDGVGGPDVGEELIAQSLALGGALDQSGDVYEFDDGGSEFLGLMHVPEPGEPLVGDGDDSHIGVDGTKGIVVRRNSGVGNGVEKSGLPNVG